MRHFSGIVLRRTTLQVKVMQKYTTLIGNQNPVLRSETPLTSRIVYDHHNTLPSSHKISFMRADRNKQLV